MDAYTLGCYREKFSRLTGVYYAAILKEYRGASQCTFQWLDITVETKVVLIARDTVGLDGPAWNVYN